MKKKEIQPRQFMPPQKKLDESLDVPSFTFVAGYTSWGFPYGTSAEKDEADPAPLDDVELPF